MGCGRKYDIDGQEKCKIPHRGKLVDFQLFLARKQNIKDTICRCTMIRLEIFFYFKIIWDNKAKYIGSFYELSRGVLFPYIIRSILPRDHTGEANDVIDFLKNQFVWKKSKREGSNKLKLFASEDALVSGQETCKVSWLVRPAWHRDYPVREWQKDVLLYFSPQYVMIVAGCKDGR